jgi:sigma-B regulation protein RsbU (phosphoserine phosphatase)
MFPHDDLLLVMAGTAIFTIGILSLCAHFASALSRERILLWFGLFAAPYGLALVYRSILVPGGNDWVDALVVAAGRLIALASSIPALLLFQEFYGKGWRLSSKWVLWSYALALLSAFFLMAMQEHHPKTIPSPGIALVILVPLVLLVDHLAGYRPPPIQGRLIIFAGLLIFFLTFSYDHIANLRARDYRAMSEPFGFLVLTACLGYVVSRRVTANEAEWISMADEMRAARKIQSAILPSSMPHVGNWSVAARYAPMTAVAGDFYGFPQVPTKSMDIILADVKGHGVPAALVASMVKVSVFAEAGKSEGPGQIVGSLNCTLCREAPEQYATAIYFSLSQDGVGRYCAAGHPPPFLWHRNAQRLEALDAAGLLLGVRNEEVYEESRFDFEKGDRLLLYSDGLTEAENGAGLSFGDIKLANLFASGQDLPAEQFADELLQGVLAWSTNDSGPGQSDDITFVVVDLE